MIQPSIVGTMDGPELGGDEVLGSIETEGALDGKADGDLLGKADGSRLGCNDGMLEGMVDGSKLGTEL